MKAEKHFEKGEKFECSQLKLDPANDPEVIIESCYMAAHHFLLAGLEWRGIAHPQSHAHSENAGLLSRQAKAPQEVRDAWKSLDDVRPGSIYGTRGDETSATRARSMLKIVKEWAEEARPQP